MEAQRLQAEREMLAAANGDLLPDPLPHLPARRQIYAIARLLLKLEDLPWPRTRTQASELIAQLRRRLE